MFPQVPARLQEAHQKGFKLVIMTNQSDIGKAAKPDTRAKAIAEKTGRLNAFTQAIGLPMQILVATAKAVDAKDPYRKPATGMWDYLVAELNPGYVGDKSASFFVGDAAGRKKDHGDSDKRFAEKSGLTFYTEDVFFAGPTPSCLS